MVTLIATQTETPSEKEYMLWLYNKFKGLMFATAYKYIADPHIVEEVIQESLMKLIAKVSTLQPMPQHILSQYIVSTVKNNTINCLKKQSTARAYYTNDSEGFPEDVEAPSLSLDELIISKEAAARLGKIWPLLPMDDQLLLEGKYILGYSDDELGRQFGCAAGSVRMKLTRARRRALALLIQTEEVSDR